MTLARTSLAAVVLLLALATLSCGPSPKGPPPRRARQRVLVMGFDGMDPTLAGKWMDEGKLPNLKQLADRGTLATLRTTQPSESPTAWATFATGVNPGKHNIYDFLVRDLDSHMPDFVMVRKQPPRFLWGLFPTRPPQIASTRGGTSFWVHAGNAGRRCVVLTVPVTFPPEEVSHGELLAGLPTPDVRGTLGTFLYWATDLSSFEEGNTEFGGFLKRLLFDGGVAQTLLKGPENPILEQEEADLREKQKKGLSLADDEQTRLAELATGKDVNLPMTVRWTGGASGAEIEVQGRKITLRSGEWSDWVPLEFEVNALVRVHGMTQFHLIMADHDLRVYASPVNFDPRRQNAIALSRPESLAARLAGEAGVYRTLGWAESADKPLNESRLDEGDFLYDSDRAFDDRRKIILKSLDREDWDLFVAAIETTDRVSHMMWRLVDPKHPMYDADLAAKYGDAIEKTYRRADDLVGRMIGKAPPGTIFILMSDHGFHSFRRSVSLNTWLAHNGYLVFAGQPAGPKGRAETVGRGKFWDGVDWSRTRAYALGLGPIYFNLRGRESRGIVSTGGEYAALQEEIASKLAQLTDPDRGQRVMRAVYRRDDTYKGEYLANAPDLQPGFNEGYRVGGQDTLGGIGATVVENNDWKWSGDHCATAAEISGGVLFVNRKIAGADPGIADLSPTVLKLLDAPLPADLDGKPLM